MTTLRGIDATGNQIEALNPAQLAPLVNVEKLVLTNNKLQVRRGWVVLFGVSTLQGRSPLGRVLSSHT